MTQLSHPDTWTPAIAAEYVAALSPSGRTILASALQSYAERQNARRLLAEIQAGLAEDLSAVAAVYFESFDYDGLYYFNETGTTYYTDGRPSAQADFSITVNELMTTVYGRVGSSSGLMVTPCDGEMELWETGAEDELAAWRAQTGHGRSA